MSPAALITLREVVRVQKAKPSATPDAGGHVRQTDDANWVEHCTRRAEVVAIGGRELVSTEGQQVRAQTLYRVRMRYDGLTRRIEPRMRLVWNGKKLNVEAAFDPDGLRREMRLSCTEELS